MKIKTNVNIENCFACKANHFDMEITLLFEQGVFVYFCPLNNESVKVDFDGKHVEIQAFTQTGEPNVT